jgi:endonuclease YncB( thermonuclease family)
MLATVHLLARKKRHCTFMRLSLALLVLMVALSSSYAQETRQADEKATTSGNVRVVDGDTIKLDDKTFHLDGIDAPEFDQSCLDAEGATYPCGQIVAQELTKLIGEQRAYCEDLGADTKHKTRRIGHCYLLDGADINLWLVQQGWAINFEPYAKSQFKGDEGDARVSRVGMWKGCFVAPRDFRRWNRRTATLLGENCPLDAREKLFPHDPPMPPGCNIKGKYAWRAWPYRGIYHVPDCGSYRRTTKVDRWFCSEEDARAANFRGSFTCWWP